MPLHVGAVSTTAHDSNDILDGDRDYTLQFAFERQTESKGYRRRERTAHEQTRARDKALRSQYKNSNLHRVLEGARSATIDGDGEGRKRELLLGCVAWLVRSFRILAIWLPKIALFLLSMVFLGYIFTGGTTHTCVDFKPLFGRCWPSVASLTYLCIRREPVNSSLNKDAHGLRMRLNATINARSSLTNFHKAIHYSAQFDPLAGREIQPFTRYVLYSDQGIRDRIYEPAKALLDNQERISDSIQSLRLSELGFQSAFNNLGMSELSSELRRILRHEKHRNRLQHFRLNAIYDWFPHLYADSRAGLYVPCYVSSMEAWIAKSEIMLEEIQRFLDLIQATRQTKSVLDTILAQEQAEWDTFCSPSKMSRWRWPSGSPSHGSNYCKVSPAQASEALAKIESYNTALTPVLIDIRGNYNAIRYAFSFVSAQLQHYHASASVAYENRATYAHYTKYALKESRPMVSPTVARRALAKMLQALNEFHGGLWQGAEEEHKKSSRSRGSIYSPEAFTKPRLRRR